jgi:carbon monoxide dehydrogenase subunit G
MIETEQRVLVGAPIERVWDYAFDIKGWARLMPGLQDCVVVDEHDSRWVLKVGVGGLVRTVTVLVHVDEWAGPGSVLFSYALEGDPVGGGGRYTATRAGPDATEVTLQVRVVGEGAMAAMWEAMGKPLLPQLARSFAQAFKAEIESQAGAASPRQADPGAVTRLKGLLMRLRDFWRRIVGSKPTETLS